MWERSPLARDRTLAPTWEGQVCTTGPPGSPNRARLNPETGPERPPLADLALNAVTGPAPAS